MNAGSAVLNITNITASGDFAETNNCGTALPAGGGTCKIQITFTPTTTGTTTDQITITDNAAGSPHIITVTGNGVIDGGIADAVRDEPELSGGGCGHDQFASSCPVD